MKNPGIIIASLAFLLASCSAAELGMDKEHAALDGLPTINGRITDQDGEPIEHIKVTLDWGGYTIPDVVYTSSDGIFRAEAHIKKEESVTMAITFEDIDGEANGGSFETLTDTVILYYKKENEDGKPVIFDLDYRLTLSTASESNPQS